MVVLLAAGCSPSGPRALLKGKRLIERGDYADAVTQLKTATSLMATNAQAWNYLGVACQYAGQPGDAATAYQRALALDRDLMEAHYNLGCLWLEQNKPDAAQSEFTAYTLRRSKAPEGWLKLGLAQLQAHDVAAAEKSFSTVLYLSPDNAEALNGLGMARVERRNPRDAAQFFTAATTKKPDFGPAWLNLGVVAQQYLHDNALALQSYRTYLALKPRPANWDDVNNLVNSLEPPPPVPAAAAPTTESRSSSPPPPAHVPGLVRTQAVARAAQNPPRPGPPPPGQAQVVKVAPEPVIIGSQPWPPPESAPAKPPAGSKLNPLNWFRSSEPENPPAPAATTPASPPPPPPPASTHSHVPVTPLGPASYTAAASAPSPATPTPSPRSSRSTQPSAPTFPRYLYISPRKPAAGDRSGAQNAFNQARGYEQDSRWQDALQAYRQAAESDPAWFEAQYNCGVMAYRLRDYSQSLTSYEMALAIQPESADARYNFALALKAAGYVTDAVNELKKILADRPDDVRAHLALGNIYAQQLYDPAQARQQYLKVLELDPRNPKGPDIQFWLSSNPP